MGGTSTTTSKQENELPQWYQEAAVDRINFGKLLGQVGYLPWMGPDVAALSGQQVAGMEGTNALSEAFGMPTSPVNQGLPDPTEYNGLYGYSSFPMYEQGLANLAQAYPAQADFYSSFFINPITGQPVTDWEPAETTSSRKKRNKKRGSIRRRNADGSYSYVRTGLRTQ